MANIVETRDESQSEIFSPRSAHVLFLVSLIDYQFFLSADIRKTLCQSAASHVDQTATPLFLRLSRLRFQTEKETFV